MPQPNATRDRQPRRATSHGARHFRDKRAKPAVGDCRGAWPGSVFGDTVSARLIWSSFSCAL
jgi:hypothetical protein